MATFKVIKMQESKRGNKNAAKNPEDKSSAYLHIRCMPDDKNKWTKAAQADDLKLSEWIVATLNKATE